MRLYLTTIFIFISSVIFAQKWETTPIPSIIKPAFEKSYTTQNVKKWKKSRSGIYIVRLIDKDNKTVICRYNEDGSWLETITYISKEEVLTKIIEETERTYPDAISIDYHLYEKAEGPGAFLIDVITENNVYEIIYSLQGKFINISSNDND